MDNAPAAPLCIHGNCQRARRYASGRCRMHERRSQAGGDMDAPARPEKKQSVSGSCTLSLCLIRVYADGLCRQHWVRRQEARRAGTEERGEWKGPVKAYRRRGDVRFIGANVSRRTHRALRVQAKKDGVTLHAMVGLALDEWARKWQLQRSNPDEVEVSRDMVARPDAWSQRPEFAPDED